MRKRTDFDLMMMGSASGHTVQVFEPRWWQVRRWWRWLRARRKGTVSVHVDGKRFVLRCLVVKYSPRVN